MLGCWGAGVFRSWDVGVLYTWVLGFALLCFELGMFGEKVLVSLEIITFFAVLPQGTALQGILGLTLWFGFCHHLAKGLAVVLKLGRIFAVM